MVEQIEFSEMMIDSLFLTINKVQSASHEDKRQYLQSLGDRISPRYGARFLLMLTSKWYTHCVVVVTFFDVFFLISVCALLTMSYVLYVH